MVIRKAVCRDCDNAIPHNAECCPGYVSAAPFDYYRNTDCLLTSLLVQTLPAGLCRQCLTHRLPGKYEKTSAEVGNARKSAHYRPHLRTPFPFDFEFFVVAIPLNVTDIILVPDNRNIFSF